MKFILFLITVILFSCSEPKATNNSTKSIPDSLSISQKDTVRWFSPKYKDTIFKNYPYECDSIFNSYNLLDFFGDSPEINRPPFYNNIQLNRQAKKYLPADFLHDDLLKSYFGNDIYYARFKNVADSIPMAWWKCETCKTDSLPYMGYYGYSTDFPGKEINTTLILDDQEIWMKERKLRLIHFITYPDEFSPHFTGRFNAPVLGYFLFEKRNTVYQLLEFNPKVGTFGSYNHPVSPQIISLYNQIWIIYECSNGGAGAPYTSYSEIYFLESNSFKKRTTENFLSCNSNAMGEWKTNYQFYEKENDIGIKLITTGYFVGLGDSTVESYPYVFEGAPQEFMDAVEKADKNNDFFEFVYERFYPLNGDKYEKIVFKKLKGEWITR